MRHGRSFKKGDPGACAVIFIINYKQIAKPATAVFMRENKAGFFGVAILRIAEKSGDSGVKILKLIRSVGLRYHFADILRPGIVGLAGKLHKQGIVNIVFIFYRPGIRVDTIADRALRPLRNHIVQLYIRKGVVFLLRR